MDCKHIRQISSEKVSASLSFKKSDPISSSNQPPIPNRRLRVGKLEGRSLSHPDHLVVQRQRSRSRSPSRAAKFPSGRPPPPPICGKSTSMINVVSPRRSTIGRVEYRDTKPPSINIQPTSPDQQRQPKPGVESIVKHNEKLASVRQSAVGVQPVISLYEHKAIPDGSDKSQSEEASQLQLEKCYEVEPSELEINEDDLLGRGAFGSVYKGLLHGKQVAIKKFHAHAVSEKVLKDFRTEVSVMSQLRHPNVILFIGACTSPGNLLIITELMKCSVYSILHPKSKTQEPPALLHRLQYAQDCCLGMMWLHREKHQFLHLDLKSLNLLVDENGTAKVADFGLTELKSHLRESENNDGTLEAKGSVKWMAPELHHKEQATVKCDVYSFGITLWEILTCRIPWEDLTMEQVIMKVCFMKARPSLPENCSPTLIECIKRCWADDPADRPTFVDIFPMLQEASVEVVINDAQAAKFWKACFLEEKRVKYEDFQSSFQNYFSSHDVMNTITPQVQSQMWSCLKAVVTDEDANLDEVSIFSFASMVHFFGPLTLDFLSFLKRIFLLLREPYFHGNISKDEAESLLSKERRGTFLIRFSTVSGNYTASIMKKEGVSHTRLGQGGKVCDNLPRFLKTKGRQYEMRKACPGSKYQETIFAKSDVPSPENENYFAIPAMLLD